MGFALRFRRTTAPAGGVRCEVHHEWFGLSVSRVAVDAMGGDHAPREIILGVLEALERDAALEVFLVGRESAMREHLVGGVAPARVTLVNAEQFYG